ncbi:transposase [Streptomyces nojiriensis]|uniref:transposase n=1 Tax=Streptomyces nojiriensis TaxID=66374 RepID=UPI0036597034
MIVTDAGHDVTGPARVLRDLPVELVGRVRGDRVMRLPKPPRVHDPRGGRPPKRGLPSPGGSPSPPPASRRAARCAATGLPQPRSRRERQRS